MAVGGRNFGDFGAVQPLDQAAWLPRYLVPRLSSWLSAARVTSHLLG